MKNAIIIILSVLVVGFGAYIVIDKIGDSKKDGKKIEDKNNLTEKEEENEDIVEKEEETDYDISLATKLLEDYVCTQEFRQGLSTDSDIGRFCVAYKRVAQNAKDITVDEIEGLNCENENYCEYNGTEYLKNAKSISYETLNASYKYLFGKESTLEKKDYKFVIDLFHYDNKSNSFILLTSEFGFGPAGTGEYIVESAKIKDGLLYVDVLDYFVTQGYNCPSKNYCIYYESNNSNEDLDYNEFDTMDELINFVKQNKNKVNQLRYIFTYENEHYALKEIKNN